MVKPIITNKDQLHIPCVDVDLETANQIVKDLIDTASEYSTCAGLAANQIGYIANVFVIRENENYKAYIHPSFTPNVRAGIKSDIEGCMSLPEFSTKKRRWKKIVVNYQDESGNPCTDTLKGFVARVFQHEFDHLQGKLISD